MPDPPDEIEFLTPSCLPVHTPPPAFPNRALASRISQALLLLRTLSSQNITRLAARLERGAAQRLRELVSGEGGKERGLGA
jgi:hypothetical protein